MAKIINPITEPVQETQYYLSSFNGGVSENLPMDSRFAKKMSRGAMRDPNMFLTTGQQASVKQYIPAAQWSKDERRVFLLLQDIVDKTGTVPTVAQISQISKGRAAVASNSGNGMRTMSMQATPTEETMPANGLTTQRVQRALNKLQKRGIVNQMAQ
jgi:hypothetical protein